LVGGDLAVGEAGFVFAAHGPKITEVAG
jgi:hypothetical protein